jgi:hypothetical protein
MKQERTPREELRECQDRADRLRELAKIYERRVQELRQRERAQDKPSAPKTTS